MIDRDKMKELHNSVTELHKTTSMAATGTGAIDWEGILDLTISILTMIKSNFGTMQNEFRRSTLETPESIDDKSEAQQQDHQDALSRTAEARHPNTPQRAGFAENIAETTKGAPPNPPLKAEGSPPERSPVNNQNDPTNPPLNKPESTKVGEPPARVEPNKSGGDKPNPTELTIDKDKTADSIANKK